MCMQNIKFINYINHKTVDTAITSRRGRRRLP